MTPLDPLQPESHGVALDREPQVGVIDVGRQDVDPESARLADAALIEGRSVLWLLDPGRRIGQQRGIERVGVVRLHPRVLIGDQTVFLGVALIEQVLR
jgi:hypothetical protein